MSEQCSAGAANRMVPPAPKGPIVNSSYLYRCVMYIFLVPPAGIEPARPGMGRGF